ncbi:MAG: transglutaminase-like domain-containing protein, partial [Muribaculaceae bacterium]|nr:transglutaminase-like domain-containing protein [Muribaculaceae bacterium]
RMSPEGVWKTRRADNISRSIFFVAGARSMGIPARIDPVSGKTQYAAADKRWVDVDFGEPDAEAVPEGRMVLSPVEARTAQLPGYYTHFSLSRIEDGLPQLLNYDENATVSDFSSPVSTDTGHYMLLTGRRMADGSVMAHAEFFTVAADSLSKVPFVLRNDPSAISVIGNFNSEDIYYDKTTGSSKSILSTTGRGYYALGLIRPGHEPSVHALNDLSAAARELDKWGRPIVLLFPDRASLERFDTSAFPGLPAGTVLGVDEDGKIAAEIASALNLDARDLPIFIIADTFNRVVFASQGYTIGLGQQMAEVASRLTE